MSDTKLHERVYFADGTTDFYVIVERGDTEVYFGLSVTGAMNASVTGNLSVAQADAWIALLTKARGLIAARPDEDPPGEDDRRDAERTQTKGEQR